MERLPEVAAVRGRGRYRHRPRTAMRRAAAVVSDRWYRRARASARAASTQLPLASVPQQELCGRPTPGMCGATPHPDSVDRHRDRLARLHVSQFGLFRIGADPKMIGVDDAAATPRAQLLRSPWIVAVLVECDRQVESVIGIAGIGSNGFRRTSESCGTASPTPFHDAQVVVHLGQAGGPQGSGRPHKLCRNCRGRTQPCQAESSLRPAIGSSLGIFASHKAADSYS